MDELSPAAQEVIRSYTETQQGVSGKYAALCAATGVLPWAPPTAQDHETLLKVLHPVLHRPVRQPPKAEEKQNACVTAELGHEYGQ